MPLTNTTSFTKNNCVLGYISTDPEEFSSARKFQLYMEDPEGVKWELGLVGFVLGKWGSSHTGTGIWSLGMRKKC